MLLVVTRRSDDRALEATPTGTTCRFRYRLLGAITDDELDSAVVTLLRLDDDDGKVAFAFFMQDGAAGEIKVNWVALLPLGKIKVKDSPASIRIIFCCDPSPNEWRLTPIRYCNRPRCPLVQFRSLP